MGGKGHITNYELFNTVNYDDNYTVKPISYVNHQRSYHLYTHKGLFGITGVQSV